MSAITPLNAPLLEQYGPLYETSIRRKLFAELSKIGEVLQNSSLKDETSELIRIWHHNFLEALNNLERVDEHLIKKEYIQLLQETLVEPIFKSPLDENPLLGSDGRTYGSKALKVFEAKAPDKHKKSCPCDLESEEPFSTTPHPLAKMMLDWLKQHDSILPAPYVDAEFAKLESENPVSRPQITISERHIRLRRAQRQQEERLRQEQREAEVSNASVNERIQNLRSVRNIVDQRIFEETHRDEIERRQRMDESLQQIDEGIINLRERTNQFNANTRDRLNNFQRDFNDFVENSRARLTEGARLIEEIREGTAVLEEEVEKCDGGISDTKRQMMQLQISVNQTREAIKKREQSSGSSFLEGIITIGACVLVTFISQGTLGPSTYGTFFRAAGGGVLTVGTRI